MIDIIGAAFDLCGLRQGSRLGPAAIRLAGIQEALEDLNYTVRDTGDVTASDHVAINADGLRNFDLLLDCVKQLRERSVSSLQQGNLPLVLGGEHTLVMACVSAALEQYGDDLALLWIDAHTDINTPGSSSTGNLHGMPLAALTGMPSETEGKEDEQWRELLSVLQPGPRLKAEHIAWYAIRDVDPPERERLKGLAITMHEIDRYGIEATIHQFDTWIRAIGAKHLWISFDVDALDPILAPGTGTGVRGGLSYREAHLCAELLSETMNSASCPYRLAGIDIVETNPLRDNNNSTAEMAVEWIGSLMGKTILGKR